MEALNKTDRNPLHEQTLSELEKTNQQQAKELK